MKRSKQLKELLGLKDIDQLASFIGVARSTIFNWDKQSTLYPKCDCWPCDAVQKCKEGVKVK